jgi:hypothetical protein
MSLILNEMILSWYVRGICSLIVIYILSDSSMGSDLW